MGERSAQVWLSVAQVWLSVAYFLWPQGKCHPSHPCPQAVKFFNNWSERGGVVKLFSVRQTPVNELHITIVYQCDSCNVGCCPVSKR